MPAVTPGSTGAGNSQYANIFVLDQARAKRLADSSYAALATGAAAYPGRVLQVPVSSIASGNLALNPNVDTVFLAQNPYVPSECLHSMQISPAAFLSSLLFIARS